jgi:hypothetical protein
VTLAQDWDEFHQKYAKLRLVHKDANLGILRKRAKT